MAKQAKSHELRWFFLREYTRQLITNSTPIEIEETFEPETENKIVKETPEPKFQSSFQSPFEGMMASPKTKIMENIMPLPKRVPMMTRMVKPPMGSTDIGKLNMFLRDPRVSQIEVNGPGREVLVRIGGNPQRTRVKLTKEEIDKIIKDFSEKTRIPVVQGVFKTALGNLTLTAVISDFVDTRFTIQKRKPFQRR